MTTRTIKRIDPASAAKICAVLYGIMGGIMVPFMLLGVLSGGAGFGTIFVLFIPLFYAVGGMLSGFIGATLYNLVSGWVGGVEIDFDE